MPLKLLAEAEGEELLDEDDDAELTEGVDVDPAVLTLEPELDVDSPDDEEVPEVVELTGAPMLNAPLVASTSLTLLIWTAWSV